MSYDKLDNEELLRLALAANGDGRDAEGVAMLKTLLEREPGQVHARYLLAAQHAQMGLYDRAEVGFRAVVVDAPEFPVARFQLGQLLILKGAADEARQVLEPVARQSDSLGTYARAMIAAAGEDAATAIGHLEAGLALPQEIPALAVDMQRLLEQLRQGAQPGPVEPPAVSAAAPMFLSGYGRGE